jgi:putative ABC transport system permease protein
VKLSKNLRLSAEILSAHKWRTGLSILGIVIGIAAVVLMVSAGEGSQKRIMDRIRSMGTDLIVVSAGQTRVFGDRKRQIEVVTTLEISDAKAIAEECPSVELAAASQSKKISVRIEAENTNTNVMGMTADGFAVRNLRAARGRLFGEQEDRARQRVAVLGPTVVENLFGGGDPIGAFIRIGRVQFEVIGVAAPRGIDVSGLDQDDVVLIPLATAMRRVLNVTHLESIFVKARSSSRLREAEEEIRALLRRRHRLGKKPDDFSIQNQASLIESEREMAGDLILLVGSVAGISLLVGGVGILAVMLISLNERVREIGLRRALGARKADIKVQFLLESTLLSLTGGVLGIVIGVGGALALSAFGAWETLVPWRAIVGAFASSVAIGILFGFYPAVRAAALEPIEALRSE